MGDFHFNTNTWGVAHHHGHSAFRLLRIVCDIETEHRTVLHGLTKVPYGQSEYLELDGRTWHLTKDMFRISCASIMMFQAMMEAIINDSLERENALSDIKKKDTFYNKWTGALRAVEASTTSFATYKTDIYDKFRIPMLHPKNVELNTFDELSFKFLLAGYKNGWLAFEALHAGLGHPHDADSWITMCTAHDLEGES